MLIAAFAMLATSTLYAPPGPQATAAPSNGEPAARRQMVVSPGDLYSARAKRRVASYLRMRLLELRLRGLDRAADVIEHHLPVDALLRSP